jgi:hypothetical protein
VAASAALVAAQLLCQYLYFCTGKARKDIELRMQRDFRANSVACCCSVLHAVAACCMLLQRVATSAALKASASVFVLFVQVKHIY